MVWVLETLKPSEIQEILTTSQTASQATDAAMGENYVYHLTTGTHHVGRKDASIVFNDKAVSRKHAELAVATASVEENVVSSPALSVTDLGSTFGTSVNGQKLTKSVARTVTDGDVIHFGAQWSAVRVKWLPLVFCVTRMAKKEKLSLKAAAVVLGASVVAEWGPVRGQQPRANAFCKSKHPSQRPLPLRADLFDAITIGCARRLPLILNPVCPPSAPFKCS